MASLDVIALDPTVPQLRAPGVGDTYHFCRVVEFQDGTDAAPSITNVGDTNTGIYWPNADELAVSTNGVQRLSLGATTVFNETGADVDFRIEGDTDANLVFVDASTDRVGLGLNNPDRLLDVDGSSKFRGQILITSGEALSLGLQALQLPTGVESTIGAGLSTRTGVAGESIIQFGNNMNTYYTGSVNAAKAGAMIRIDTRGVEPTPGASAYSVFQIQTRAAGVADPNYTVPVQIGAAPQGTFCIQTNGLATFNYGFVVNEGGGDYDTRFEGDTDTHLFFADASTDRIGIGTSTPGYKLDVNGTANFANNVTFTGGTANGVLYLNASKVATSGSALTFDGTNLGLGTSSPSGASGTAFVVNGGAGQSRLALKNTNSGDASGDGFQIALLSDGVNVVYQNRESGYQSWELAGSEAMRLTSTGLGIGTSSPGQKLEVAGNILVNTSGNPYMEVKTSGAGNNPYLKLTADTNSWTFQGTFSNTNDDLLVLYNSSTLLDLDKNGNLGLGVTPTVQSGGALQLATGKYVVFSNNGGSITGNAIDNSGWKYVNTNFASRYEQNTGTHAWYTAGTGTAGNAISFTQAMTLDASGNLGVGTTIPSSKLHVKTGTNENLEVRPASSIVGAASGVAIDALNDARNTVVDLVMRGTNMTLVGSGSTPMIFQTNATERARIDAAGNMGLGVTPSAWGSGWAALQIKSGGMSLWSDGGDRSFFSSNMYYDGTNRVYMTNGTAMEYAQDAGIHAWKVAASGTAGNTISFTQAMTLDASGNLSAGTTSIASSGQSNSITSGSVVAVKGALNAHTTSAGIFEFISDKVSIRAYGATAGTGLIAFNTGGGGGSADTERARITSGGYFKASDSGTYAASGNYHEFYQTGDNLTLYLTNSNATPEGIGIRYVTDVNGTGSLFLNCIGNATQRAAIRSNGGLANYQSNNVDLSDARTKKDITPAASMWDKIGALEIVTYKYNDQTHDDVNVGVIAQQVESVEPIWVDNDGFGETPEGEEPLKTVYTKDITFAAIKALQEAMARIEKLEAEVAALKGV